MGVTQTGKRIEELIGKGLSPQQIHHDTMAQKSTILAAASRLGVLWINDTWESVQDRAHNSSTEHAAPSAASEAERTNAPTVATDQGYEQPPGAPVPDSEKAQIDPEVALRIAVTDGIAANKHLDRIAAEEHCTAGEVVAIARDYGLIFNADQCWVLLEEADKAHDAATQATEPSAQPEHAEALMDAIDGSVAAGWPPMRIAFQLKITELQVLDRALERGMHWEFGKGWLTTDEVRAAIDRIADASARPDSPQGAEADVHTRVALAEQARDNALREEGYDAGYTAGRADEREQHAAFTAPTVKSIDGALDALEIRVARLEHRETETPVKIDWPRWPDRGFLVDTLILATVTVTAAEVSPSHMERAERVAERAAQELAR